MDFINSQNKNNTYIELRSHEISSLFIGYIVEMKDKLTADNHIEIAKVLKTVRTVKHTKNVWEFARCDLVDPKFQNKMNKAENKLPLKNGKVNKFLYLV